MISQELKNKKSAFSLVLRWCYGSVTTVKRKFFTKRRINKYDRLYGALVIDKNVLSKQQHKEIKTFWNDYFHVRHSLFAYYTEKTELFDCRYIPDSIHTSLIDQFYNDWSAARYIDNKCYYPLIFQDVNIPKTIAYRLNGYWYHKWGGVIDYQQVIKIIMNEEECFIKKATDSWGGLGVVYFKPSEHSVEELKKIIKGFSSDIVIQQGIKQSKTLAEINPDSVNTIRTMSMLKNDGTVKIYSSILRMGIKGAKVDNASSGGISTGIKPDGRLKDVAYSNEGVRYDEHPTSHVKFGSIVIPNFSKIEDLVVKLHPRFPHFRLISWDIAVDVNDEPILIEANLCDGELDFHQLNNGPIFGDDTESVLAEVFQK